MDKIEKEEEQHKKPNLRPSKDPEYVRQYSKQYYLKNKERINATNTRTYYKNIEYWKEYQQEYQKKRYEKIKCMIVCTVCNKEILNTSMRYHVKTKTHMLKSNQILSEEKEEQTKKLMSQN